MISDLALVTRFHDQLSPSLVFIPAPSLIESTGKLKNALRWGVRALTKVSLIYINSAFIGSISKSREG